MILVHFRDGTHRQIQAATVTFAFDTDDGRKLYGLDDLVRLEFLGPTVQVADGTFRGMPIRGLVVTDGGDAAVRVDVPMPLDYANDLGEKLAAKKIDVFRTGPPDIDL